MHMSMERFLYVLRRSASAFGCPCGDAQRGKWLNAIVHKEDCFQRWGFICEEFWKSCRRLWPAGRHTLKENVTTDKVPFGERQGFRASQDTALGITKEAARTFFLQSSQLILFSLCISKEAIRWITPETVIVWISPMLLLMIFLSLLCFYKLSACTNTSLNLSPQGAFTWDLLGDRARGSDRACVHEHSKLKTPTKSARASSIISLKTVLELYCVERPPSPPSGQGGTPAGRIWIQFLMSAVYNDTSTTALERDDRPLAATEWHADDQSIEP